MDYNELDFSEKPTDYYFRLDLNVGGVDGPYFMITPKSYYDSNKCLLDSELAIDDLLEQNYFYYLTDSTYEYNGDPNSGRAVLLSLGLIENNNML